MQIGGKAAHRILKANLEIVANVFAALRAGAAAATALSEDIAEPKEIAQNVAEIGESRFIEAGQPRLRSRPDGRTVIGGAFLRIAQDSVGFRRFFEFFFGFAIVRIPVGMVLQRELAIGTLQRLLVAIARDAQNFIIIAFCDTHLTYAILLLNGTYWIDRDFHHGGTQKPAFEVVAALIFFQDSLIRMIFCINHLHRMVNVWIESGYF